MYLKKFDEFNLTIFVNLIELYIYEFNRFNQNKYIIFKSKKKINLFIMIRDLNTFKYLYNIINSGNY